jgi:hypothetical protein
MDLRKQFEEETGNIVFPAEEGLYSPGYEEWLEDKVAQNLPAGPSSAERSVNTLLYEVPNQKRNKIATDGG